jgi:hypothetical protein
MKKVISIVLVALLMLNVLGYYGLVLGLKYQNTQRITQQLDADLYEKDETITLHVPLAIPYYAATEFERVNGEIEYGGEFYRLVKQKFLRDTLYIVCIKDVKSKHIKQALTDYVKTFTDHPVDGTSGKTVPGFIKDYLTTNFGLGSSSTGWNLSFEFCTVTEPFSLFFLSIHSPPPEA